MLVARSGNRSRQTSFVECVSFSLETSSRRVRVCSPDLSVLLYLTRNPYFLRIPFGCLCLSCLCAHPQVSDQRLIRRNRKDDGPSRQVMTSKITEVLQRLSATFQKVPNLVVICFVCLLVNRQTVVLGGGVSLVADFLSHLKYGRHFCLEVLGKALFSGKLGAASLGCFRYQLVSAMSVVFD